jgi:hypothetical protein
MSSIAALHRDVDQLPVRYDGNAAMQHKAASLPDRQLKTF